MRRLLICLLLLLSAAVGDTTRRYYYTRSVSGTSNIVSVAQPSSSARPLELRGVYFKCSVACTWTVSKNGTVTGGAATTIQKLDDRASNATAELTTDGTVDSDTTVLSDDLAAAASTSLSGGLYLPVSSGTQRAMHFKLTSGGSGTLLIYFEYDEP